MAKILVVDDSNLSRRILRRILEPAGATFLAQSLAEECRQNQREGSLTRLVVKLPPGQTVFTMEMMPGTSSLSGQPSNPS